MNTEPLYRVVDSSTTVDNPLRVHEVIVNGKIERVEFHHGKDTLLPYDVAIKFMQAGFTVQENGKDIARPAKTDETIRLRIAEDEVVAKLDELTDAALRLRSASRPDGERFINPATKREDMIAFLMTQVADDILEADKAAEINADPGVEFEVETIMPAQTGAISVAEIFPDTAQPPVDNDHVEPGARKFTQSELEAAEKADADDKAFKENLAKGEGPMADPEAGDNEV